MLYRGSLCRALRASGVAVASWLAPGVASGEDTEPTVAEVRSAADAFAAGSAAFKEGKFTEAAGHFEQADESAPNERALTLAILSRKEAGQLDRAATLAQLATSRYPGSADVAELTEPILAQAAAELLVVDVRCGDPCSLLEGPRIIHGAPSTERRVYLMPGERTLRAGWAGGRSESRFVAGEAGSVTLADFRVAEEPPEPAQGLDPIYFWVGAGLTAVVGGASLWSGIAAANDSGTGGVARTNVLVAGTAVLGVTTAVVGVLFTSWGGGSSTVTDSGSTATVTPWVGVGSGAMMGARGRF